MRHMRVLLAVTGLISRWGPTRWPSALNKLGLKGHHWLLTRGIWMKHNTIRVEPRHLERKWICSSFLVTRVQVKEQAPPICAIKRLPLEEDRVRRIKKVAATLWNTIKRYWLIPLMEVRNRVVVLMGWVLSSLRIWRAVISEDLMLRRTLDQLISKLSLRETTAHQLRR